NLPNALTRRSPLDSFDPRKVSEVQGSLNAEKHRIIVGRCPWCTPQVSLWRCGISRRFSCIRPLAHPPGLGDSRGRREERVEQEISLFSAPHKELHQT